MTYPCTECGKHRFSRPTVCFWCADTRTPEQIQAEVQQGIVRARDAKPVVPLSALEEARLKLHKYRRYEKGGGSGQADQK